MQCCYCLKDPEKRRRQAEFFVNSNRATAWCNVSFRSKPTCNTLKYLSKYYVIFER